MTDTGMGTQALAGQRFKLIESKEGRSRGALLSVIPESDRIDYIGVLPTSVLSEEAFKPSHIVTAVTAAVFVKDDIKSRLLGSFPRNSALEGKVEADFLALPQGGFIHMNHVRNKVTSVKRNFVDIASDFIGRPYIWGGTGQIGVDCSGLVQSALAATGTDSPRDADQQELALGLSVGFTDRKAGDLLFWPGHVGILMDDDQLLHANAHHMSVVVEPVKAAVERIGTVRTTKRL